MAKRSNKKKRPPGVNQGHAEEAERFFSGESPTSSASPAQAMPAGAPTQPGWRREWLLGGLLVAIVFLVYQPVWWAGYIGDDVPFVTANPCIIGPLGLKEIWTTRAADICPLTLTTFWIEHALWGLAPLPYHLVNVFMHSACAVLLWRVLRSLRVPGAWLGAALWSLHPVQVESVAWITEMKNTQSGLFFLLAILFFLRTLRERDLDGRVVGDRHYALTLLFAALAMAQPDESGAYFSDVHRRGRPFDVDTKVEWSRRFPVDANRDVKLAAAPDHGG